MQAMVPSRPIHSGPCTCVWPAYYALQADRILEEERAETLTSPLSTTFSALGKAAETVKSHLPGAFDDNGGFTPAPVVMDSSPFGTGSDEGTFSTKRDAAGNSSRVVAVDYRAQTTTRQQDRARLDRKKGSSGVKTLASAQKNDVLIRSIKKVVSKSSESSNSTKMRSR